MFSVFLKKFLTLSILLLLQSSVLSDELEFQDPTQPVDFKKTQPKNADGKQDPNGALTLEAIIISGDYKLCIVGGKIIKIGDHIMDKTLVSIEPESITLKEKSNKNIVLKLSEPEIKELSHE